MRAIDGDWLEKQIALIAKKCAKSDAQKALAGRILLVLDNAPTLDCAPIKRGKWLINPYGYHPYCSECMNELPEREITEFCPKCGADMRGDVNEEIRT